MDINDIRKRRALINHQISKGFNDNFDQENISKAYDDEFNKAHKVGDVHPNGKWVWTEYKPGKFDWRGVKKTKGSTAGSKVSPTAAAKVKVGGAATNGAKPQTKSSSQDQGYGFIFDESGNKIPLTLEVAEAVYKRWSNSVPVNTGKGKFPWRPSAVPSPKMKNDGLDFRTADGCKADIADRAAAAKKLVDKIKADQSAKTPMQKSIDKQPLDAQEKKYLLWKEAGPASNLSSINRNFKREVTSTEEGLHVFKGKNDWFEMTVKKDGNKFVYTLYRVDGLPKVKMNELEKHSAIAATVTSDKQIKVAKTFYKKLFS